MDKLKCPEIRFGGFEGDWKQRRLSEIATMYARIGWQNLRTSEFLDRGNYMLITGTDFDDGNINYATCHYVEKDRYEQDKYIQIRNGSILITKDGTLGKVAYVQGLSMPATLNAGVFNVEIKDSSAVNGLYLFQYLKAPYLMNYVGKRATGGTIKHLNQNILVDFPVVMSTEEEQTAIGNFFQKLDQSIVLQQQKYTQTQNLKKAMLEKMFPKAGSKQPEIRIKGFGGDWENFRIFDIAQNKKLNNGVFNDQAKVGKGYKLINVLDMYIESDINEANLALLDLERKEFELNKVKYGDVFFTRSSLVKEGIAFSNVYLGRSDDITYDGHLIKLSPNFELVNPIFLNYCLKTSKIRTQLILGGKSTTMTTIGQQEVGNTTVDIPTLEEQTAIGQFFKQLDDTLALQQQQLQTLKNLKQAFLGKMFV